MTNMLPILCSLSMDGTSHFVLSLSFNSLSQDNLRLDSPILLSDSVVEKQDSIKPHSIRTAVLLSAVIPGAGQIYNHIAMPKGKKKAFLKVW